MEKSRILFDIYAAQLQLPKLLKHVILPDLLGLFFPFLDLHRLDALERRFPFLVSLHALILLLLLLIHHSRHAQLVGVHAPALELHLAFSLVDDFSLRACAVER